MARIQKVKLVLAESYIPDKAEPLTVFIAKDTQNVWLATATGEVLNLSDIIAGGLPIVRTPGPAGRQGERGVAGPQGDPGKIGPAGRDGIDGREGRQGIAGQDGRVGIDGAPGPAGSRGEKGDPGSVTFIGPAELDQAVATLRAELLARTAKFKAAVVVALERNAQRHSGPTRSAIDAVIRKIKIDAGI